MELTVIGVLEFDSIATGLRALDAMVKAAPVRIVQTLTVCPGRYVVIVTGDVASVEASLRAGKDGCGFGEVRDELFIQNLHPGVGPAVLGTVKSDPADWDALGVIETLSVTSGIEAADCAVKESDVRLLRIQLSGELGGKSLVKFTGTLDSVQAALERAAGLVRRKGQLAGEVVIPRPHGDMRDHFISGSSGHFE